MEVLYMDNKKIYDIGIKLENQESYDRLMKDFSSKSIIGGLDFEGLFQGYPDDYPVLIEYMVDFNPFEGFLYKKQL